MAAGITYTPIATTTLGSNTTTVTFSSISASYTDLILVMSVKLSTSGLTDVDYRFNGDTGSNYSRTWVEGNGTGTGTGRESNQTSMAIAGYYDSTNWTTQVTHFFNYSNTTTYKTAINRESTNYGNTGAKVGLWRSTSAINEISVFPKSSKSFSSGSTFSLYGITAA